MYPIATGPFDAPETPEEDLFATAGEPLPEGAPKASEEEVIEAMRTVYDPEIPVNIYDLGLIYTWTMDDAGDVEVTMSLTAPACPVAGEMPGMVAEALAKAEGVGQAQVTIVWDPPWNPDMMSEDAKMALDFY